MVIFFLFSSFDFFIIIFNVGWVFVLFLFLGGGGLVCLFL